MKRWIAVILTALLLTGLLTVTAGAVNQNTVILSDDLQTLTLNDQTYSRADLSAIGFYCNYDGNFDVQVPQSLQSQLKTAVVSATYNQWILSVELYYLDGARLDICFVSDLVKPELVRLCQDDTLVCGIEFWWEDVPSVTAPISHWKGTPTELDRSRLSGNDYYNIVYQYRELDAYVYRGCLQVYKDRYYYVDYRENNIPNAYSFFPFEEYGTLKAYEITDPVLIAQIDNAFDREYGVSSDVGTVLVIIFFVLLFALLPMGILIPSLIFCIRGKGYTRLSWGITAGLCIAELGTFVTLVLLPLLK